MYFTLYTSKFLLQDNEENLRSILEEACHNNKFLELTGLLIYLQGQFLQVIEGPKHSVTTVIDKIMKDTRHCDVDIIFEGETEKRLFPDWSMGMTKVELSEFTDLTGFQNLEDLAKHHKENNDDLPILFMQHFLKDSAKKKVLCY